MYHTSRRTPEASATSSPSAAGDARVAALPVHEALLEARGALGCEALDAFAVYRRHRRRCHNVGALDRGVPVQHELVVGCPAGGAAATAADELHGHAQRLRAGDLGALLRIWLPAEVRLTAVLHSVGLQGAGVHEERALRMLVKGAAGYPGLQLAAWRRFPLLRRVVCRRLRGQCRK